MTSLGGSFTFGKTSLTVNRMGYGAMQLAGPGVWGPPKDPDGAVAVLREAVAARVNHIYTSYYYGPHVTNQLIKQALHPYPNGLVIVTKLGGRRPPDKSWQPAISLQELTAGVHDNLRNLGLDVLDIVNYRVMGSGHGPEEGSIAEQVTVGSIYSAAIRFARRGRSVVEGDPNTDCAGVAASPRAKHPLDSRYIVAPPSTRESRGGGVATLFRNGRTTRRNRGRPSAWQYRGLEPRRRPSSRRLIEWRQLWE
jgi:hypothetical protein